MSSSDDEAPSPDLGASSSKDPPPQLESESSHDEDELPVLKSKKGYRRPRLEWREVIRHRKGNDALRGEDEMKLQITPACNQIMEESRVARLHGHMPAPTDIGLWKLKTKYTIDHGRTSVKWCYCPWHIALDVNVKSNGSIVLRTLHFMCEASIMRTVMRQKREFPSI